PPPPLAGRCARSRISALAATALVQRASRSRSSRHGGGPASAGPPLTSRYGRRAHRRGEKVLQRDEVSISRAQHVGPVGQVAPNQDIVVVEPDLPHAVLRYVLDRAGQLAEFDRPHIGTQVVP